MYSGLRKLASFYVVIYRALVWLIYLNLEGMVRSPYGTTFLWTRLSLLNLSRISLLMHSTYKIKKTHSSSDFNLVYNVTIFQMFVKYLYHCQLRSMCSIHCVNLKSHSALYTTLPWQWMYQEAFQTKFWKILEREWYFWSCRFCFKEPMIITQKCLSTFLFRVNIIGSFQQCPFFHLYISHRIARASIS